MLKSFGFNSIGIFSEEQITVVVLWIAFVIYNVKAFWTQNPLFGSVYEWVIIALWWNITSYKSQYTSIASNSIIIAIVSPCGHRMAAMRRLR